MSTDFNLESQATELPSNSTKLIPAINIGCDIRDDEYIPASRPITARSDNNVSTSLCSPLKLQIVPPTCDTGSPNYETPVSQHPIDWSDLEDAETQPQANVSSFGPEDTIDFSQLRIPSTTQPQEGVCQDTVDFGHIKVIVRLRPTEAPNSALSVNPVSKIIQAPAMRTGVQRKFVFDAVYDKAGTQQEIYENCVAGLVQKFIEGHNATLLAYGQTGSGKTYTMGTEGIPCDVCQAGMLPRAALAVFDHISQHSGDDVHYSVECQFLEVYNEDIIDLLRSGDEGGMPTARGGPKKTARGKEILVRETEAGEVVIVNVAREPCASFSELLVVFQQGTRHRSVSSTLMNHNSSRSHAIFTIYLHRRWRAASGATLRSTSKMHMVDLAGSERLRKTGNEGDRLRESVSINGGLLTLGKVVSTLARTDPEAEIPDHVPYRDSKLTRLLADSLGGVSATVFIACISPDADNVEESVSTMQFAGRARHVRARPLKANAQQELLKSEETVYATLTSLLRSAGATWAPNAKPRLDGLLDILTETATWNMLLAYRQAKRGVASAGNSAPSSAREDGKVCGAPMSHTIAKTKPGGAVPLGSKAAAGLLGRRTDVHLQSGDVMMHLIQDAAELGDMDMLVRIVQGMNFCYYTDRIPFSFFS